MEKFVVSALKEETRPRLRLRALVVTLAVLAGAPADAVVAHEHWSSEAIFNNYYRLSSKSHVDFHFVNNAVPEQDMQILESQSQDPLDEVQLINWRRSQTERYNSLYESRILGLSTPTHPIKLSIASARESLL